MKQTLQKQAWYIIVAVAILLFGVVPRLGATIQPYFNPIMCSNGYPDAYLVVIVDTETGCVKECFGRDCAGKLYTVDYLRESVSTPPNLSYTNHVSATAVNGAMFHVYAQVGDDGIKSVWGIDAAGAYYIGEAHPVE